MHRGISLAHVHVRFFFLLCASRTMLAEAGRCYQKTVARASARVKERPALHLNLAMRYRSE
jgi:hypothetical protein